MLKIGSRRARGPRFGIFAPGVLAGLAILSCGGCTEKDSTHVSAPANAAPVVDAIPSQDAVQGTPFTLDLKGYVADDHDADGDLAFTLVSGGGAFADGVYGNTFAAAGNVTVSFIVRDTGGSSTLGSFNVSVAPMDNDPPTVNSIADQNATVGYVFALDVAAAGGITDDHDATEGLTFTVTSGGGRFSGTVYLNTYATAGANTVQFTVKDSSGEGANGSFNVVARDPVPDNLPPEIDSIPGQNATERTPFSVDLSPFVTDDHDAVGSLTFAVASGGGTFAGSVYNHTFGSSGPVQVQFVVMDTQGMSSIGSIQVDVEVLPNSAPVVSSIPDQTATVGYAFFLDLGGYVSDDHDADKDLAFAVVSGGGAFIGTVYTRVFDSTGTQAVSFTVTDTQGGTGGGTFNVDVQVPPPYNLAPVVSPIPAQNAVEGAGFTLDLAPFVSDDHDPDDSLFAAVLAGGGSIGGASNLEYSNTFSTPGEVVVQFMVRDTGGMCAVASFTVTVTESLVNNPPEIRPIPYQATPWAVAFAFDLAPYVRDDWDRVSDLVFAVTSGGGSFSGSVYSVVPMKDGVRTVGISVTDTDGATSTAVFRLFVAGSVWYVDGANGDDLNAGTSWAAAFRTIGKGLAAASNDHMIRVAGGTYMGPGNRELSFAGKRIYVTSMSDPEGCIIDCENAWSGFLFNSGETADAALRGFTILRGYRPSSGGGIHCEASSPTIQDCRFEGCLAGSMGGAISCASESNPVLLNCVITGSHAPRGGSISCHHSHPQIISCEITRNTADNIGGGIFCTDNSNPLIKSCSITNNLVGDGVAGDGGGITCGISNPTISDCLITNNGARMGGGIQYFQSSPIITRCTISQNLAASTGGGLYADSLSGGLVQDCVIAGNTAMNGGGISVVSYSSPVLERCWIVGNEALSGSGGGIFIIHESRPTMVNCTLSNNRGKWGGGIYAMSEGLHVSASLSGCLIANNQADRGGGIMTGNVWWSITNCTIANNAAQSDLGGGLYLESLDVNDVTLNNTILWGNTAPTTGKQIYNVGPTDIALNFCCYANGSGDMVTSGGLIWDPLSSCIKANPAASPDFPKFADAGSPGFNGGGNYRLKADSPCIDRGRNSYVPVSLDEDLDGNPRIVDGPDNDNPPVATVDIGAYERP